MRRVVPGVALVFLVPIVALAAAGGEVTDVPPPVLDLVAQVGVLILAARAGNLGASRVGLPGFLGELAAGIVMGPFLLGALPFPGFPKGLFPAAVGFPVSTVLYGISALGAVLLLFAVGLRTDVRMFLRYSRAGTAVGCGGVLTAFLVGDLAAGCFGARIFGKAVGLTDAPCLLLGVVSAISAAGVTVRFLAERRRLDSPEGVNTLAAATVGEVLGMVALAAVLGLASAQGTGGADWARLSAAAALALGVWLLAMLAGRVLAGRIGDMLGRGRERATVTIAALGLALVVAALFEAAGLATIVGAYVMGLTLSRTDLAQTLRGKLDGLCTLLLPVVIAVLGMLVDVRSFGDLHVLGFGFAFSALAILAKVAGGGGPALFCGFNVRGALRVGVGMVPRGEVALVVAGVGLASGVLSQDAFSVVVLMTILSVLSAAAALRALYRGENPGLRHARPLGSAETIRFPCDNPRQAEWIFNGLQNTLHRDGFLVHVLEPEDGAVLALRGRTSMAFRLDSNDILFTCERGAAAVVKTAVLYVVRELRAALEAVRRPLDVHHLLRDIPSAAPAAADAHDLKPYLRPDLVKLRLQGTTGAELLAELVALVQAAGLVQDAEGILAAVQARERSMSTGLERGIAVPHCRTDAVRGLTCAIGLKPEGVDFGAFDGQPSRVFVLTLSPVSEPTPHVQFMSQVIQALTPAVCQRLLRAESTHEVIAILSARAEAEPALAAAAAPPPRQPVPHALRATALTDAVVIPRLQATTKEGAIAELLEALAAAHPIEDTAQVKRQLLQHEQAMSTGLERGIAVPHCRTAAVSRVLCALGLKPDGLDFGSQDGAPTQIVVLILASTSMPTPYAQTLAMLLRALTYIPRAKLLACADPAALHAMILHAVENLTEAPT